MKILTFSKIDMTSFEERFVETSNLASDDCGYDFDDDGDICIRWGGYEYWITSDRIDTAEKLSAWMIHILEKEWEGTTQDRVGSFMATMARKIGFSRFV